MKANSPTGELCSARWRVVMSAKGDEFCVRDVLDAAWFRGELEAAWTRLLQEAACEALADERALEAEAETLQAMSEEFRYERDLLTAEETEQWLVARDLTEEEFSSWFQRRYWYERLQAAAGNATYPVGPPGGEPFVAPTTKGSPPGNQSYPAASPELWEMLRAD